MGRGATVEVPRGVCSQSVLQYYRTQTATETLSQAATNGGGVWYNSKETAGLTSSRFVVWYSPEWYVKEWEQINWVGYSKSIILALLSNVRRSVPTDLSRSSDSYDAAA